MWDKEEILYHLNYMLQCLTLKETGALKSLRIMMNAHSFAYTENKDTGEISLRFDFSGSHIADQVVVTFCPAPDCFRMAFYRNGCKDDEFDNLYFDDMRETFRKATGLETRAPNIIMTIPNISLAHVGDRA